MAFNEALAQRVRSLLIAKPGFLEKKMFGGICFMLHGNMACGVVKDLLVVRVGPGRYNEALERPHCSLFDLTGRPMTGWVQVSADGWNSAQLLSGWVEMGVACALSLPAK
jgi:hypothetical protein